MKSEEKISKRDIAQEQTDLFNDVMRNLTKEEEKIRDEYGVARSLACTEWSRDMLGRNVPNKILPDRMDILLKNFERLLSQISRRKYYAIVAFSSVGIKGLYLTGQQSECFKYWEKELGLTGLGKKTLKPLKKTPLKQHI